MMQIDEKTLEELKQGRDEFRKARKSDKMMFVCQLSELGKRYVRYLVDSAIEDGADREDAMEAFDSKVTDLDDLAYNYDDLDDDDDDDSL